MPSMCPAAIVHVSAASVHGAINRGEFEDGAVPLLVLRRIEGKTLFQLYGTLTLFELYAVYYFSGKVRPCLSCLVRVSAVFWLFF